MTWICCSGVTARALSGADSRPRRFTNRWRSTLQGIRKGQGWRAVVSGGNRTAGWSPVTPSISTPCLGRAEKMRQVPLRTSMSRVVPAPPERTSCTISAQAMAALQDMASAAQGTLPGSSASNGAPAPPGLWAKARRCWRAAGPPKASRGPESSGASIPFSSSEGSSGCSQSSAAGSGSSLPGDVPADRRRGGTARPPGHWPG
jgi:hypothetical protein